MSTDDRFELGEVVATLAAIEAIEEAGHDMDEVLERHASGDWGDVTEFDRIQNEEALELGGRLFSAYKLGLPYRTLGRHRREPRQDDAPTLR